MTGIYKFTNKITGESYVGASINIQKRYNAHKNRYGHNSKCREHSYFHDKLEEYGFSNFDFEVLEECNKEQLTEKEQFYIKKFDTVFPRGYNVSIGGNAPCPQKLAYYQIEDIKQDLKNRLLSEIEIAKKYHVNLNTVSLINVGKMWFDESEIYPLRKNKGRRCKKDRRCSRCGNPVDTNSKTGLCISCWKKERERFIPQKQELSLLLKDKSQEAIGRVYGVSGKAVSKWRKKYGLDINGNDV